MLIFSSDQVGIQVDNLDECGVVITITLQERILIPVTPRIVFSRIENELEFFILDIDTQFFNVTEIRYMVTADEILFSPFTLRVSLTINQMGITTGPSSQTRGPSSQTRGRSFSK